MKLTVATAFLTFLFCANLATASVLYDNGSPSLTGVYNLDLAERADDFTLTGPATVEAASFWGYGTYSQGLFYRIYADNAGLPGAVIAEGSSAVPEGFELATHKILFNFEMPVTLMPGTYWFGLHDGMFGTYAPAPEDRTATILVSTTSQGSSMLSRNNGESGFYSTGAQDLSFELYDEELAIGGGQEVIPDDDELNGITAPEPGTFALIGFAGLAMAIRSSRSKRVC